ncbi:MAG: hypothetical protein AAB152_06820 [Candidatus Coatesbacteria bacterium]
MSTDVVTLSAGLGGNIGSFFGATMTSMRMSGGGVEALQFEPAHSAEDFDMLNTPEFMNRVRKADDDIQSGRVHSTEQLRKRLGL